MRVFRRDGRAFVRVLRGNPLEIRRRGGSPSILARDMAGREVDGSVVKLCTVAHVDGHEHTRFRVSVLVGMDPAGSPPESP